MEVLKQHVKSVKYKADNECRCRSRVLLCRSFLITTGIILFLYTSDSLKDVGIIKFFSVLAFIVLAEALILPFTSSVGHVCTKQLPDNVSRLKQNFYKSINYYIKCTIAIAVFTIIYYAIIIIFGAPLLTYKEETLVLSLTLTCLTLIPAIFHSGLDRALMLFIELFDPTRGEFLDDNKLSIYLVLIFTWLSAFVLPLDWNRPWQTWPIPCVCGAFIGYFISHVITIIEILILRLKKDNKCKKI